MDIKTAIQELKELQKPGDAEAAHINADYILCEFLRAQGFNEIVDEYEKIQKWYA